MCNLGPKGAPPCNDGNLGDPNSMLKSNISKYNVEFLLTEIVVFNITIFV